MFGICLLLTYRSSGANRDFIFDLMIDENAMKCWVSLEFQSVHTG